MISGVDAGEVAYFAPDTLEWEGTEKGYSDFLVWCFSEHLAKFYEDYRWPGWEEAVKKLGPDQGYHIAPPPFTENTPYVDRSWKAAHMKGLYEWYQDMKKQVGDLPTGSQIIFREGPSPDSGK